MTLNWTGELAAFVSAQIATLLSSDGINDEERRRTARATNALPVYSDMSGTLCLRTDGTVCFCDWETGAIDTVRDDRWRIIAAVVAAERFPELQPMLPNKPLSALDCSHCGGSGCIHGKIRCGKCFGLGWKLE